MTEPLDYQKLESVCWRAIRRHDLGEREMVILSTIVQLSFGIGEPFLRLDYAIELSRLTGITKGNAHETVKKLKRGRALEVSEDRCIYTPLPPSKAWPWLFSERVNFDVADEMERALIWAAKGPQQAEFLGPTPEREFAESLAIERMRTSLVEFHHTATARFAGGLVFPVKDRLPSSAPASGLSSGAGHTRPLGTSGAGALSSEESLRASELEANRVIAAPQHGVSNPTDGTRNGNPVPESSTPLLRAFTDSKHALLSVSESCKAPFPNREPLRAPDPGASEQEIVDWLRPVLGKVCKTCFDAKVRCACTKPNLVPVMDVFGGWWRNAIRESRYAAVNVCMQLVLRLTDPKQKPLKNRGGWARDQWYRIRGEEGSCTEIQK